MRGTITKKQIEASLKGFNTWKKPQENGVYMLFDGNEVKFVSYIKGNKEEVAKHTRKLSEFSEKDMLVLSPKDMDEVFKEAWTQMNRYNKGKGRTPTKPVWVDALFTRVTILNEKFKEHEKDNHAKGSLTPQANRVIEEFLDKWQSSYGMNLFGRISDWEESKSLYMNHPLMVEMVSDKFRRYSMFEYSGEIYDIDERIDGTPFLYQKGKLSKKELKIAKEYIATKDDNVVREYLKEARREEKTKLVENLEQYGKVLSIDNFSIGVDGRLNGLVTTDRGQVSIISFFASGYVQSLHIRHKATLLKSKKK